MVAAAKQQLQKKIKDDIQKCQSKSHILPLVTAQAQKDADVRHLSMHPELRLIETWPEFLELWLDILEPWLELIQPWLEVVQPWLGIVRQCVYSRTTARG